MMRSLTRIVLYAVAAALSIATPARGEVIAIGPFQGTLSDNFNTAGVGGSAHQQLSILGGFGTVRNLTPGGSIKVEFSSSLDGDLVVPRSPPLMIGQLGISEWVFAEPLAQFGGYFENNSRFDDARVDFYDMNGALIDSVTATVPRSLQNWTWNGWQSDVPIQRIVITGNDTVFLSGFIWFDDVQVVPAGAAVPEPLSLVLLSMGVLGLTGYWRFRRRRYG